MANTRADRLRKARKAAGFRSASEAARSLGVSPSTYIHHENGTRDFDESAANLYSRRYHVAVAWLLLGDGEMQTEELSAQSEAEAEKKRAEDQEYNEARSSLPLEVREKQREDRQRYEEQQALSLLKEMTLIPEISPTFERDFMRLSGYWRRYISLEDTVSHPIVGTWGIPEKQLQYEFGAVPGLTIAFPINGNVNSPTLNHGDLVLVDTAVDMVMEDGLFLIADQSGYPQVRRLSINLFTDPRTLTISADSFPDNKHVAEETSINIVGRVKGRISRM
ncbi:MAG: hypothetical protein PGN22_02720 [Agrobacterium cavarae]